MDQRVVDILFIFVFYYNFIRKNLEIKKKKKTHVSKFIRLKVYTSQ